MASESASPGLPVPDLSETLMGIADGLLVLDQHWRFLFVNEEAARTSGRQPRELIGKNIWEEYPYLAGTQVWTAYHQAMQERKPVFFELKGPGQAEWYQISVSPVPAGIAAVWMDKTREKAADLEREVVLEEMSSLLNEKSQENILLKIAQEATLIGVWEWDARTDQVWWSRQTYDIYGYPPGQSMTWKTSLERVFAEDQNALQERMLAAIQSHEDFRYEYRIRHPERGIRWVEGFARILYDTQGQMLRMIGTVRDITTRTEMETTLRQSLERERARAAELSAIMDAVPALVMVTRDPDSRFIDGNRMAHDMLHLQQGMNLSKTAPAGQVPQSFHILRHGQEIQPEELPIQVAAAKGVSFRKYDFSLVLEDGTQTDLIGNVTPLFDANGNPAGAVAAFVDITGQKQASDELRRLSTEIEQRDEQQEKGRQKLARGIELADQVFTARSLQEMLQVVTTAALELTESQVGSCCYDYQDGKFRSWATVGEPNPASFPVRLESIERADGVYQNLMRNTTSFRQTRTEVEHRPGYWGLAKGQTALNGLLGARLTGLEDQPNGLLMVANRVKGNYTREDEAILAHLASVASARIRQIREHTAAERVWREASRRAGDQEKCQWILDSLLEYLQEGVLIAEGPEAQVSRFSRYGRETLGEIAGQADVESEAGRWMAFGADGHSPLPVEQMPLLRAIRQGEVVINQEMVQINAAGLPLRLTYNAGPIRDRSGAIVGAVATWRDHTDLRQVQEALLRSETRLRLALAHTPATLFTLDRNLRYTWMHIQHKGLGEKIVLGRRSDELPSPADVSELVALQQSVIDRGTKVTQEIRLRVRGKWTSFLVILESMLNSEKQVSGATGAMVAISRD